jgi:hypothetical protein
MTEKMVKEPAMNYLNVVLNGHTVSLEGYEEEGWEVDYDGGGMTLSENRKNQTAKLSGKLYYEVDCWLEGSLEVNGSAVFAGTGVLVE